MLKTPIELCGCHHIHDSAGTAIFKLWGCFHFADSSSHCFWNSKD
jgi:hypothetical protein